MSEAMDGTVFRYSSPELTVEIKGEESFVREQIECMGILDRIVASLASGKLAGGVVPSTSRPAPPPAVAAIATAGRERAATVATVSPVRAEDAQAFFERCHAREGKGAHFDRVLLIGYWLEKVDNRKAFSKADIERTYEEIGLEMPRHLDQVIGSIRRDHELFEQAGRIGRYRLTESGLAAARELGA